MGKIYSVGLMLTHRKKVSYQFFMFWSCSLKLLLFLLVLYIFFGVWWPKLLTFYFVLLLQDQMRALDMIQGDSELSNLALIQAPLVDVEIRGVPALRFMGDIVWKWYICTIYTRSMINVSFNLFPTFHILNHCILSECRTTCIRESHFRND